MKTTEELLNDIKELDEPEQFLNKNKDELRKLSLSEYLQALLEQYQIKKSDLFRRTELIGNNYGYELFQNDRKKPSRDILLQICLAFPLTIEETQQVLRRAGWAILYPRDKRDALLLYALKKQLSIDEVNSMLCDKELTILGGGK